jgi:hypothetical protein
MMRHAAMGVLILSAIGIGSALAQTSVPGTNPPMVPEPAKPAVPEDRRADGSLPDNGIINPSPDARSGTGTTVRPPNVDPAINVAPPGTAANGDTVVPK